MKTTMDRALYCIKNYCDIDDNNREYIETTVSKLNEGIKKCDAPIAVTEDMVLAFHSALSDSSLSQDECNEILIGLENVMNCISDTLND